MKHAVRAVLTATISLALALGAAAQAKTAQSQGGEKTVEEAYLQETAESIIIKELANSDDKDDKILALLKADKAIAAGRKNDDIRNTLQYLALENSKVVVRSGGLGPVTNNFPDVRRTACEYLGEFPSVESKDTLVTVIRNAKIEDPMVLAEAIRSLGKIGINDNDEVVQAIADTVSHFSNVGMSEDRLAVYTLFALDSLAEKNNTKDMATITNTIKKFTKGSYVGAVRQMALSTLEKLAQYQSKNSSSKK